MSKSTRQTFKQRQFGANVKVHIFASGKQRVRQALVPSWFSIKRPVYIEVPTLDRFAYVKVPEDGEDLKPVAGGPKDKPDAKVYEMFRKPATDKMKDMQCDACAGPHNKKNALCSATLKLQSPYNSLEPGFYDIKTRQKLPNISVLDEVYAASARVSKVTFVEN